MSALFSPATLAGVTLPNRIVVSPMCQYSAEEGVPNDWHMISLGRYAAGGYGLIFTEATHVSARGRITPGCAGLYNDMQEQAFARIFAAMKAINPAPIGMQIAHAGRKGSTAKPWLGGKPLSGAEAWLTEAPSAIAHEENGPLPQALDEAGLARIKAEFVSASERAIRLGVDVIELHAAHGYLLHQFCSPVANQRSDAYGGSRDKRLRFPLEVFEAVRAICPPNIALGARITGSDWVDDQGIEIADCLAFAGELKRLGADFVDVSSGGVSTRQKIPVAPGYQVHFAAAVKKATGLPTMAVGMITQPHQAEAILVDGKADMIAMARAVMHDPLWPWRAAEALGEMARIPPQYLRGAKIGVDTPREAAVKAVQVQAAAKQAT